MTPPGMNPLEEKDTTRYAPECGPLAVQTLNTAAPKYNVLKEVFAQKEGASDEEKLTLVWKIVEIDTIVVKKFFNDDVFHYAFTQHDLFEICPSLVLLLQNCLTYENDKSAYVHAAETLWRHVSNPGIFMHGDIDYEHYLRDIKEVTHINTKEGTAYGKTSFYTLLLEKKQTPESEDCSYLIENVLTDERTYAEDTLQLKSMENLYPGFTQRAHLALDLGLSGKDVALHAMGAFEDYSNKETCSDKELTKGMPDAVIGND